MIAEPMMAAALAAVAGIAAAQLAGPISLGWPAGPSVLRRRMNALADRRPGRMARVAGNALLVLLLTGGTLTAYAAAPSGPDALPSEVVGVVGSGEQLSLKVAQDQKIRTVKLGDEYRDGWTLKALTTSTATLSKDGQARQVGLNPTGALGETPPKGDPSKVEVAGDTLEAREVTEKAILEEYWAAMGVTNRGVDIDELARHLGPARYQAFLDNDQRLGELRKAQQRADALARGDFNTVRFYDHQPVAGPDSFVVPAGMNAQTAAQALGLTGSLGYSIDGAATAATRTMVMVKCFTPTTPSSAISCGL